MLADEQRYVKYTEMTPTQLSGRLTGIVLLIAAVTALWPAQGDACSCVSYTRNSIYPPKDSKEITPLSHLSFSVGGYSGYSVEHRNLSSYQLIQEAGPATKRKEIPIHVQQYGSVVQLKPKSPMAAGLWYRLVLKGANHKIGQGSNTTLPTMTITRFRTSKGTPKYALPKKMPRILKVEQVASRANSSSCRGRSAIASFYLQAPEIPATQRGQFLWMLQIQTKAKKWRTYQAMPLVSYVPYAKKWTRNLRLDVGHGQCSRSPVFSRKTYVVRAVLMRSDGKQWASPAQTLPFRY